MWDEEKKCLNASFMLTSQIFHRSRVNEDSRKKERGMGGETGGKENQTYIDKSGCCSHLLSLSLLTEDRLEKLAFVNTLYFILDIHNCTLTERWYDTFPEKINRLHRKTTILNYFCEVPRARGR